MIYLFLFKERKKNNKLIITDHIHSRFLKIIIYKNLFIQIAHD